MTHPFTAEFYILEEFVEDVLALTNNDFDEAVFELEVRQSWPDLAATFRKAHAHITAVRATK